VRILFQVHRPNMRGGGGGLIICEKLKMPCVGIFLKIEYCEGMLSYTEVNMCFIYRNSECSAVVSAVTFKQNYF
jgi:hypothetical protein